MNKCYIVYNLNDFISLQKKMEIKLSHNDGILKKMPYSIVVVYLRDKQYSSLEYYLKDYNGEMKDLIKYNNRKEKLERILR